MRMMLLFKKDEALRHVGHLDLLRTMQRAFRRSGLPMAYSQGFNPHMIMSFAAPLSVGIWAEREALEVTLTERMTPAAFLGKLNAALPIGLEGVGVKEIREGEKALMAQVRAAAYEGRVVNPAVKEKISEGLLTYLHQEEILTQRKSKKGMKTVNIKPMIYALKGEEKNGELSLSAVLSLTEKATCKPAMVAKSLGEHSKTPLDVNDIKWCRKGLFKEGGEGNMLPLEF